MEMTRQEMIEKIDLFIGSKTYTFLKDNFGYFYNGYIIKRDDLKIVFNDDKIGDIPITIDDIKYITHSKRHSHGRVA